MRKPSIFRNTKDKIKTSNIEIYHNLKFPLEDIVDVLYPLFGQYYPYHDLVKMIYTINHIYAAYDKTTGSCVACALLNNTKTNDGLYLMLFGVKQSHQKHGMGTHLLKTITENARYLGYRFIYLHVHIHNYKAIGLYEKSGFIKQQYLRDYYRYLPKSEPHAFEMILWL